MARKPTRARALGVTDADYERLLSEQGGTCALCPTKPKTRRLHVDHDHATGKVRGLLCYRCNRALPAGLDAEWHVLAAFYLAAIQPHEGDFITLGPSDGRGVEVVRRAAVYVREPQP